MLTLEYGNKIVEDTLKRIIETLKEKGGKGDAIDVTAADFGGVMFHVTLAADTSVVSVSLSTRCFAQLKKFGVEQRLKGIYGAALAPSAEATYDVTLKFDANKSEYQTEKFIQEVALLKRHALAAPFYTVFEAAASGKGGQVAEVRYRTEEAYYLKPSGNGCTVIFSINFTDADDVLFAKVFLQEFADARKNIRGAPSVTFSQKEPPGELTGVKGINVGENQGFVSFSIFPEHLVSGKRDRTVDQMIIFRDYLHYHIKCAKANLHERMRKRVVSNLQILNRAKQPSPDEDVKKKTISGKTFQRS